MNQVWLDRWPLPPSGNTRLEPTFIRLGKGRVKPSMRKSAAHRQYLDMCILWGHQNRAAIDNLSRYLLNLKASCEASRRPFALQVDCYFAFQAGRLLTVNNKSTNIDADNLLKATLDGLSQVLDIDDKHFYRTSSEKITTHSKELECALIRISPSSPRSLDQIKALSKMQLPSATSSLG